MSFKILCTNDDGVHARGLALSAEICARLGRVWTVAPDREQSATSHSLTLYRPLRATPRGSGRWEVDGTPTDCVLLALGAVLEERPDVVVSGINHGPNMGEDVLYSGTVAAAMEALSLGVPAIALSFAGRDLEHLPSQEGRLEHLLRRILEHHPFPRDTLLNVNLPPVAGDEVRGVRITTLGSRVYEESIQRTSDPWGRDIYWVGGGRINWTGGSHSDFQAIADGYISVTPLHLDLTHYSQLDEVRQWELDA
jgi:5'-nucleotidase